MFGRRGAKHFTIVDADKFNVDIIKMRNFISTRANRFTRYKDYSMHEIEIIHKKTYNPIHIHTNWIDLGDILELSLDVTGNIYLHLPYDTSISSYHLFNTMRSIDEYMKDYSNLYELPKIWSSRDYKYPLITDIHDNEYEIENRLNLFEETRTNLINIMVRRKKIDMHMSSGRSINTISYLKIKIVRIVHPFLKKLQGADIYLQNTKIDTTDINIPTIQDLLHNKMAKFSISLGSLRSISDSNVLDPYIVQMWIKPNS